MEVITLRNSHHGTSVRVRSGVLDQRYRLWVNRMLCGRLRCECCGQLHKSRLRVTSGEARSGRAVVIRKDGVTVCDFWNAAGPIDPEDSDGTGKGGQEVAG